MLKFRCLYLDTIFFSVLPPEEVKGVNYFPSRANDSETWKKILKITGFKLSEIHLLSLI